MTTKKKPKKIVTSFSVEEALYQRFRDMCHRRKLYASGVLRALVRLYVRGQLDQKSNDQINEYAAVQAGVGGRGWVEWPERPGTGEKAKVHRKKA